MVSAPISRKTAVSVSLLLSSRASEHEARWQSYVANLMAANQSFADGNSTVARERRCLGALRGVARAAVEVAMRKSERLLSFSRSAAEGTLVARILTFSDSAKT